MRIVKRTAMGTPHGENRRGVIIVLAAVLIVVLLGFVAFSVDVGNIELTRTQLQAAADSAALSGAMELSGTESAAVVRQNVRSAVVAMGALHRNGERSSVTIDPIKDITFGKLVWSSQTQKYQYFWGEDQTPYNVVKVRAMRTSDPGGNGGLPLFFAPVLGSKYAEVGAEAVATFHPRDIMLVLDFSSSMNDDSSLRAINTLGRTYIENNLFTMWQELGSPVYGKLTFTPQYATLSGQAASGAIPHIDVTFKGTSITAVSTKDLSNVVLKFSNNSTYKFDGLTGKTGTFAGTGSNSGKRIVTAWVKSGSNASGDGPGYGERFDFTTTNIKTALGLNGTYPYAGGSWTEYIQEVQSSNGTIANAGYRDKYGYLTWLDYLQEVREYSYDTADLWKTSEQPVGAMKDASGYFVDFLVNMSGQDQMGLAIYTHTNSVGAIKEHGLSTNLTQVKDTLRHRQAGHYKATTNISAGMKVAREELIANARLRSFRLMVLMTDGLPNEPTSSTAAEAAVITEANLAASNKIKILTISLGAGADTGLMQQVADITGGIHFNVPGGQTASAMRTQLENVFREIASSRPLKLVSGQ
jgi:hypothetical protein